MLCSPIGLHRISLVRASGESFRRSFFDALGGTEDACLLGGSGRGGARRRSKGRRDGAGTDRTGRRRVGSPRIQPEKTLLDVYGSTSKRIPIYTDGGTKLAVDRRLTSGPSAGPRALFVPGCWPAYRRLIVPVNHFHAKHGRENIAVFSTKMMRRCLHFKESYSFFDRNLRMCGRFLSNISYPNKKHIFSFASSNGKTYVESFQIQFEH